MTNANQCGRDAVDTAFLTNYGPSTLTTMRVWAEKTVQDNLEATSWDESSAPALQASPPAEASVS